MNQTKEYIVLGETSNLRSSKPIIGRYKNDDEIRDLLLGDVKAARRASENMLLYVFEKCSPKDECFYLISFDIKLAKVRDRRRTLNDFRKPSHEYSEIKDMMTLNLCGSIDLSTYICAEDLTSEIINYLREHAGKYNVETYYVRPWRDKDRELVKEVFQETLDRIMKMTLTLTSKIANSKRLKQTKTKANEFINSLTTASSIIPKLKRKLVAVGFRETQLEYEMNIKKVIEESKSRILEALKKREEMEEKEKRRR